ncbi:MAG: type IV pilin [Methanimicrococcus sp.]|nr:type IV pilin [Methanimicrococcus sp.]
MNLSSYLLILITVIMCGSIALSTGSLLTSADVSFSAPAKIEVVQITAGDRYNDSLRFQDNIIILKHAGGSPLPLESVSVQIAGSGNSYKGTPGSGGRIVYGGIDIHYENLMPDQKDACFGKNNAEMIKDGFWSSGEILILTGNDSKNASAPGISVSVDGDYGTSNNYGLSAGTKAEISVYQTNTNGKRLIFKKTVIL